MFETEINKQAYDKYIYTPTDTLLILRNSVYSGNKWFSNMRFWQLDFWHLHNTELLLYVGTSVYEYIWKLVSQLLWITQTTDQCYTTDQHNVATNLCSTSSGRLFISLTH